MTTIEWTEKTWNPITGCDKISQGCLHCYAADIAKRFWGDRPFSDVQFHPERLEEPLKRKKNTMWFVNSMSDLFHDAVMDEQLDQIFAVMAATPHHTYQVLTKRPQRMAEYLSHDNPRYTAQKIMPDTFDCDLYYPLPNVWLGVTVENQRVADERIPLLLQTPAAVRFLSCEPLLEPIDLSRWTHLLPCPQHPDQRAAGWHHLPCDCREWFQRCRANGKTGIDWVIIGGESGSKARPFDITWARSIIQQCKEAGVPVFMKQFGSRPIIECRKPDHPLWDELGPIVRTTGKGANPDEWPEDLRVREYPLFNQK